MNQISSPTLERPTRQRTVLTLFVTLLAAAVILVLVVLPAEYQIDPTGLGGAIGLDRLGEGGATGADIPSAPAGFVLPQSAHWKTETATIEIGAREEVEYKISMSAGSTALYSWQVDQGTLYTDFHGHPHNDLDGAEVRYEEVEAATGGDGALNPPYAGYHGWYWRNDSETPIVVTLEVTGYFVGLSELLRRDLE